MAGLADIVHDAVASAALEQLQSFRALLLASSGSSGDASAGATKPAGANKTLAALVCDFCKDSNTFGLPELTQVCHSGRSEGGVVMLRYCKSVGP